MMWFIGFVERLYASDNIFFKAAAVCIFCLFSLIISDCLYYLGVWFLRMAVQSK